MRLDERAHSDRPVSTDATPLVGDDLGRLREEGHGLISAGMETINRVLSEDNAAWLAATRQQGGQ